jgi:Na+-transporting NADH:ubiquinone oxidoreductase subunit NqrF
MKVPIRLEPLGSVIDIEAGAPLQETLAAYGVEFPCGGAGSCEGCRVRVLDDGEERCELACQMIALRPLTLHVEQWEASILTDDSPLVAGSRSGFGVAVDLGTTTVG